MSHGPRYTLGFAVAAFEPPPLAPKAQKLHAPIAELDRVVIGQAVVGDDGQTVPAGSTGTVVGIWAGGAAFEVEFSQPVSELATVKADAILLHLPR